MDVVAPGPNWRRQPFGGELHDGSLYGRGAIDAKSLGISHLAALLELERSGAALERVVIFLAVADEETGGAQGLQWLLGEHGHAGQAGCTQEGTGSMNIAGDWPWAAAKSSSCGSAVVRPAS